MVRDDTRLKILAIALSVLAGYVDAIGYLKLEKFFIAFMSGNSTRLGVGLAHDWRSAAIAGAVIAIFVLGVVAGSLVGRVAGKRRRSAILFFMSALLVAASFLGACKLPLWAIACAALAMGAENTIFEGEVTVGLTYMTGVLVKLGQHLAAAMSGGDPGHWLWHVFLWLGLIAGVWTGAMAYPMFDLLALWAAAAFTGGLTMLAALTEGSERRDDQAR